MDEILKIVLDRNKKRQVLNKNDIKRICEIIIGMNTFKEEPTVDFAKTAGNSRKWAGSTDGHSVTFYMDTIAEQQESTYDELADEYRLDGAKTDYYNYYILDTIFHEFAHVRQFDKINKRENSIETKLFGICNKLMHINGFYRENYDIDCTEHDAYCRGALLSYDIYSRMPEEFFTSNDRSVYGKLTIDELLTKYIISGYREKFLSPTEQLFDKADIFNVSKQGVDIERFRGLVFNPNNLTLYKKLLLGLPISYTEGLYANQLGSCIEHGENIDFVKKLQKRL